MVRRLLITTALEETWSDDESVLFLGEWCRLYERQARWSAMDAVVLPYHWDDRLKLQADFVYVSGLYERLLTKLADRLNQIHGVRRSVRYWRILIGPWLGCFVHMLFDRWECIRRAVDEYEPATTVVLTGDDALFVPQDMADFTRLIRTTGDEWNHRMYAMILQRFPTVRRVDRKSTPPAKTDLGKKSRMTLRRRTRRWSVRWISGAARWLARDTDAVLIRTYLPLRAELTLQLRFGQWPQYWRGERTPDFEMEPDSRQWKLQGVGDSEFERAISEFIPRQLPTAYLEGYSRINESIRKSQWPRQPRLIWTSNAHWADDVFKAWAADKADEGTRLVIGQHGGHSGTGKLSFLEDHEMAICDRYLSWGWSEPCSDRVVPVGQLKMKHPMGVDHGSQPDALLVTMGIPRYSYWMYSSALAGQYLDYLDDQYAFVEALPITIREQLVVRLYTGESIEPSWNQSARMRERLPDVRFDDGHSPIADLIRQSRLFISTYNATTFLESFSMDVPTVIFWNPAHWELRDSAIPYFEELRESGIFHETPQSAARHMAAVWDDVNGWWKSPEVRGALRRFTERYSYLPDNLLDRVGDTLRNEGAGVVPPQA